MSNIVFYPRLNISTTNITKDNQFTFEYIDRNDYNKIKTFNANQDVNKTILLDKHNKWSSKVYNLTIRKGYKLDVSNLFGKDGIAPSNSSIGVATIFKSSKSLQRGIKNNLIIEHSDNLKEVEFDMEYNFTINELRDDFELELILYLERSVLELHSEEKHINNIQGTVIGTLEQHRYLLTGDGSAFPTQIISKIGEPLWRLSMSSDVSDSIQDGISLIINDKHKDYKLFNYLDKDSYNRDFIKEVSISIVYQLVNYYFDEVKDYDEETFSYDSIATLIYHYIKIYDLDKTDKNRFFDKINGGIRR